MSTVIDLRTYVSASHSRMLVMVDLQEKNHDELARERASDLTCSMQNCALAIRHARELGLPIAFTRWCKAISCWKRRPAKAICRGGSNRPISGIRR